MENFDKIYKENYPKLVWFISTMVRDKELANDIAQNTFMKAWENRRMYNPDKSSVRTWLSNIAKNQIIDLSRLGKTKVVMNSVSTNQVNHDNEESEMEFDSKISNPLDILQAKETYNNVLSFIKSLPALKRRIALRKFIYEKQYNEIAEELNIPLGTVKPYVNQIKQELQVFK